MKLFTGPNDNPSSIENFEATLVEMCMNSELEIDENVVSESKEEINEERN